MYKLQYILKSGLIEYSPFIAPDNPTHNWNHEDIEKKCNIFISKILKSYKQLKEVNIIKE